MVASASARRQARSDLREKIKLEKDFVRKLTTLNNKVIKRSVLLFGRDGVVLNARIFESELSELLENQYDRAARVFDDQIREFLPKTLESTAKEDALIAAALVAFFAARTIEQSQIITRTNQRDINKSIAEADRQLQEVAEAGVIVTNREVAKTSGILLRRKLKSRIGSIATTEIQVAAESAKATELAILTRNPRSLPRPTLAIPRPQIVVPQLPLGLPPPKIQKLWVSDGDERVRRGRFSHVKADGQKVNVDEPFVVSGEFLKIPGDSSLGASLGNIIRCRCASTVRKKDVINARKAIFDAETRIEIETEVPIPEFGFTS